MKRLSIILLLCAITVAGVVAETLDATILEIAGKVEYQIPGKDWRPAKAGDILPKGVVISTGFKSSAVIKFGTSTITVKPVTRLSLEEIIKTETGTQTQLFLQSGRVKADVPPQPGQTTDFQVKSPTATASVRGTGFEFDGINLIVEHGLVQLKTSTGQFRYVGAGEFSYVSQNGAVSTPAAVSLESGLDNIQDLVEQADQESSPEIVAPSVTPEVVVTGTVIITIE